MSRSEEAAMIDSKQGAGSRPAPNPDLGLRNPVTADNCRTGAEVTWVNSEPQRIASSRPRASARHALPKYAAGR